jgi:RNA polymerase sigma factor (sigma-70 family)
VARSPQSIKPGERLLLEALEHEPLLRACLYRFARNNADVEDLLHSTYERLLRTDPGCVEVQSIRAFALKVARNVALDWLRHRQIIPIDLVTDMAELGVLDEEGWVEEIVNANQELALLRGAVASLPKRSRQIFTLRKVYDLSQKEIAARLNISENTVEQHLRKAARRCMELLTKASGKPNGWQRLAGRRKVLK